MDITIWKISHWDSKENIITIIAEDKTELNIYPGEITEVADNRIVLGKDHDVWIMDRCYDDEILKEAKRLANVNGRA